MFKNYILINLFIFLLICSVYYSKADILDGVEDPSKDSKKLESFTNDGEEKNIERKRRWGYGYGYGCCWGGWGGYGYGGYGWGWRRRWWGWNKK
uniref:Uncharacterized protein n=1 Tax=Meloidogyne enterolobii TaxID=390850 RepID=A0A6V7V614_MELEN|nr:unnamed protein product [Meloidogyne enterolobii]